MDYVLGMDSDRFNQSHNYIEILRSQEQLREFESVCLPHIGSKNRKDIFKRVKSIAIPNELDSSEILTTEKAGEKIRKLLGGK